MKRLVPLLAIAAGIWLVIFIGIHWARSAKPTPERIDAYLEMKGNLDALSANERSKVIEQVAVDLNRLTIEQRQELRRGNSRFDAFFVQMTPAERSAFLDRTLPEGFKQMMIAFNKMEPAKRKRFVQRALEDLDKMESEGMRPADRALEQEQTQKIINQGLDSFYNEANADVKLEMAPVIERMQQVMQNLR